MHRPSILLMNRVYPSVRGASGRLLRDLANAMAREGWQVTIITSGPKPKKEYDDAIRVLRVRGAERPRGIIDYAFVWIRMFMAALRHPAPDMLVTMTDPPLLAIAGHVVSRIKKAKHIHWCQDIYPDLFTVLGVGIPKFIQKRMRRGMKNALENCDKIIVIGRCMARYLAQNGIKTGNMAVIPNWPDQELVKNQDSDKAQSNASILSGQEIPGHRDHDMQLKTGPKFRILYAGNIGRTHPIDAILNAAEILNTEHPDIEFVFVGDGPKYDQISNFRAEKHLDNIKLLPYQPAARLQALMESGDVHIVSMKEKAAGLLVPSKVYAAMAAGRPCLFIGPTKSEAAKMVHDFGAGVIIKPGDAHALSTQIKKFRMDSDAWFTAQKGAAEAGKTFIPKASIKAWISRANKVLNIEAEKKSHNRKNRAKQAPQNHKDLAA